MCVNERENNESGRDLKAYHSSISLKFQQTSEGRGWKTKGEVGFPECPDDQSEVRPITVGLVGVVNPKHASFSTVSMETSSCWWRQRQRAEGYRFGQQLRRQRPWTKSRQVSNPFDRGSFLPHFPHPSRVQMNLHLFFEGKIRISNKQTNKNKTETQKEKEVSRKHT